MSILDDNSAYRLVKLVDLVVVFCWWLLFLMWHIPSCEHCVHDHNAWSGRLTSEHGSVSLQLLALVACLFCRMMMLLMLKLLLIRLHSWLAIVSMKFWICSIRFDIIWLSVIIIVMKAFCFSIFLSWFPTPLSGMSRENFRFEEEILGSSFTLLWHIPNWKAANRRWVCAFGFYSCLSNLFTRIFLKGVIMSAKCCVIGCIYRMPSFFFKVSLKWFEFEKLKYQLCHLFFNIYHVWITNF